jgi:DNA-binding NtrC family response regulator
VLSRLAERGARGELVEDLAEARVRFEQGGLWRMLVVELSGGRAAGFIAAARAAVPDLPILAVTEAPDLREAVGAMQSGATDVLRLPEERARLDELLAAMLPGHAEELAVCQEQDLRCLFRIAGRSESLQETIGLARRVAAGSVPVLVTGESGTGKELLSYLIHHSSPRAKNPYVRVNCAALSESLLESELFGHERGAFTGAHARRKGRFELAHRGTLLLDEISETGPRLQAELLRVLEQQDFQRLGGTEEINVDVRVICTSNRNLEEEVRRGNFRSDLYYRIRGVQLEIPPLRERVEDIEPLVWHFVNLYAGEARRDIRRLDGRMLRRFAEYEWPGNVRQLRNLIRSALILGEGPVLSLDGAPLLRRELEEEAADEPRGETRKTKTLMLQDLERQAVLEALRRTNSHQAKAAELLGISDRTLRDKMRRYREDGHLDDEVTTWSGNRAS